MIWLSTLVSFFDHSAKTISFYIIYLITSNNRFHILLFRKSFSIVRRIFRIIEITLLLRLSVRRVYISNPAKMIRSPWLSVSWEIDFVGWRLGAFRRVEIITLKKKSKVDCLCKFRLIVQEHFEGLALPVDRTSDLKRQSHLIHKTVLLFYKKKLLGNITSTKIM